MPNESPPDWLTQAQTVLTGKLETRDFPSDRAAIIADRVLGMIRGASIEFGMHGDYELNQLVSAASAVAENLPADEKTVLRAMQQGVRLKAGQLVGRPVVETPRNAPGPEDREESIALLRAQRGATHGE